MNHTERRLVADINRWRKARGWFDTNLGWVDANHTARVRPTASGFELWQRGDNGDWQHQPDHYFAPTLRSAVDILVALDVLPMQFHSIERAVKKAFADLDHFGKEQVDDRAAEYACLPKSPRAAGFRHLAECRQEQLRLAGRTGGAR